MIALNVTGSGRDVLDSYLQEDALRERSKVAAEGPRVKSNRPVPVTIYASLGGLAPRLLLDAARLQRSPKYRNPMPVNKLLQNGRSHVEIGGFLRSPDCMPLNKRQLTYTPSVSSAPSLRPKSTIQRPVLDGLRDVAGLDHLAPVRSATVRATFRMRSWARALRPCFTMARSSRCSESVLSSQYFLISREPIWALA